MQRISAAIPPLRRTRRRDPRTRERSRVTFGFSSPTSLASRTLRADRPRRRKHTALHLRGFANAARRCSSSRVRRRVLAHVVARPPFRWRNGTPRGQEHGVVFQERLVTVDRGCKLLADAVSMQGVDGRWRRWRSSLLLWRRRRGADGLDPRCYFRVPHSERGIQTHLYLASTPRRPRDEPRLRTPRPGPPHLARLGSMRCREGHSSRCNCCSAAPSPSERRTLLPFAALPMSGQLSKQASARLVWLARSSARAGCAAQLIEGADMAFRLSGRFTEA